MNLQSLINGSRLENGEKYESMCGCCLRPSQFLQMLEEWTHQAGRDLPWTRPRRLVQPFHWTCASQGLQHELLQTEASQVPMLVTALGGVSLHASVPVVRKPAKVEGGSSGVDKALLNGKVFTCDATQPWAQALAIINGRIAAVGSNEEISALCGERTEVFELAGRVVIPGFNDAHMHHTPDPIGVRLPIDPVIDPPFSEIVPLIKEAVATTVPGTWIYGVMGIDLINDKAVDRLALDELAPVHPVILLGLTNHTNVVNSAAMALLGIADDAPDPLGGYFERMPGNMRISGRIHEYAQWSPQRCFASMTTIEEGAKSILDLANECVRFGITTVQNMSWTPIERYVDMLKAADAPIRIRVIRFPPAGPQGRYLHEGVGLCENLGPRFGVSGTKWILDGTTVERGAAMNRPYADDPNTQGSENFSLNEVSEMMRESLGSNDQLLLHAIGHRAVENVIRAAESFSKEEIAKIGLRMEHGDGIDTEQVERAQELGLTVVQNPTHFLFPKIYGPRFGVDTCFASFKTLMAKGINVGIGSDGPLNPFLGLMAAVLHPANPGEACSLEQALIAYTLGSARAEQQGNCKGMLAQGYLADLAVLSQDIFSIAPEMLPATKSVLTLVNGEIVFQA